MGNIIGCQKYMNNRDESEITPAAPLTIAQKLIILNQEKTSLCKIYTKNFLSFETLIYLLKKNIKCIFINLI